MNFSDINDEHKVQINLSVSAWHIIENDISLFYNASIPNLSGPLNHIFSNYFDLSKLNLTNLITDKVKYLRVLLSVGNISDESENIICQHFIDTEIDMLKMRYRGTPKGIGKKIRISDQNYKLLSSFSDDSYECKLFAPSTGKFLSAVYEEYALLPQYEREAIAYIDSMDSIQYAIDTSTIITLTIGNTNSSQISYTVKPFGIMTDTMKRYNYVVGYSRDIGSLDAFIPTSFRISNIKNIIRTKEKYSSTKEEINTLKKGIQEKGVPFLVGELETYKVLFTSFGLNKFRSIMNLRPTILSYSGNTYILRSTQYQKNIYFNQFTDSEYTFISN